MSIFRESFLEESYMFDYMIESINVELLNESFDIKSIIEKAKKIWDRFVKWAKEKLKKIREFLVEKILKRNKDINNTKGKSTSENLVEFKYIPDDYLNKFDKYWSSINDAIRIKIDIKNDKKLENLMEKLENIGNISNELKEYDEFFKIKKGSYNDIKNHNKKLLDLSNNTESLIKNIGSYIENQKVELLANIWKDKVNTKTGKETNDDIKTFTELITTLINLFTLTITDLQKYLSIINNVLSYNNSL